MQRILAAFLMTVTLALAEGCMWSRARMNDPEVVVRARAIRPGVTRTADLPTLLRAQPTRRTVRGRTELYEYSYADTKTETFSLIVLSLSRSENVTETLYVEADAETGVVTRVPRLRQREPEWKVWPFGEAE